jgi:hypothetical protein
MFGDKIYYRVVNTAHAIGQIEFYQVVAFERVAAFAGKVSRVQVKQQRYLRQRFVAEFGLAGFIRHKGLLLNSNLGRNVNLFYVLQGSNDFE